ncbi:MAG: serine protease, partial [Planctomycetota bacterium]
MPGGARANGLERAIQRVLPRVVKLYGAGTGLEAGFGSGILVSADGLVLTVYSLLIEGHNVRAIDAKGRSYAVRIVSVDPDRQLALLRLRVPEGDPSPTFPYFDLRGDVPLQPGDWVLAAGNAFKVAHGSE